MVLPKVTVGVTVKNSAGGIKKCVDSLLALDYPKFEIIITDAYSVDGTWEILQKYGKKIKAFRVSGNVCAGRNAIIKSASGKLIAFTDSDCIVSKNWLKNLVKAFEKKDVVASGGYVATPSGLNYFQNLIGRELEDRYKNFPVEVSRLPFINICIRTDIAKKNLLDERLSFGGEDADFGYRITKLGKMLYVPEAIVYHNHRATWTSFFKQQFSYAKYMPILYRKFANRAGGDHISKPTMMIQPPLLYGIFVSLFVSIFVEAAKLVSAIFLLALLSIYIYDSVRLSRNLIDFFHYILIFLVRTIAWCSGFVVGTLKYGRV